MSSENVDSRGRADRSRSTHGDRDPGAAPDGAGTADGRPAHLTITTHSPDQTEELGRNLGHNATPGTVICLFGDLGSGKTKLTQGIARGLGVPESYTVTSPTFTLVNEYPGSLPLIHIDLFRISSPGELFDLGWEEYVGAEGAVVIEWAERAHDLLPEKRIEVRITITGENERRFDFSFLGNHEMIRKRLVIPDAHTGKGG